MTLYYIARAFWIITAFMLTTFTWIGINGLVRSESNRPWLMIAGGVFYIIGALFSLISFSINSAAPLFVVLILILVVGALIFSVGFALHGTKALRLKARITELEMMNLAQATELERLRNR